MTSAQRKLVTIIGESILEDSICKDILELGATGYTVTDARGSGDRGRRGGRWSTSSNVRIEVVCQEDVAERIKAHVHEKYFNDYAMILFETDISTVRPDKF